MILENRTDALVERAARPLRVSTLGAPLRSAVRARIRRHLRRWFRRRRFLKERMRQRLRRRPSLLRIKRQ